jgi:hypothetical protein
METPMNTKILSLAAALAATLVLTPQAYAGGGVRLGFGFPMGHFTATPARSAKAYSPGGHKAAKHTAPSQVARKSSGGSDKKVAKSESKSDTESNETTEVTSTGSTALLETSKPVETAVATTEPAAETKETPVEKAEETKKDGEPSKTSSAELECKKFIPAVGLTITVGCK